MYSEILGGLSNVLGTALGAEETPSPPKPALTFRQLGNGRGSAQKKRSRDPRLQAEEWQPWKVDSRALSGHGGAFSYCVPGKSMS